MLLWISVTLGVFWIIFMLWLRVVAFSSKPKRDADEPASDQQTQKLRPIGLMFLFDRLLPHYQIISANYDIEKYYKRIPSSEAVARAIPPRRLPRLRIFEWPVEPVTSNAEIDRIENWLLVLRIFGVIFAIFLAAAIGALVVR